MSDKVCPNLLESSVICWRLTSSLGPCSYPEAFDLTFKVMNISDRRCLSLLEANLATAGVCPYLLDSDLIFWRPYLLKHAFISQSLTLSS